MNGYAHERAREQQQDTTTQILVLNHQQLYICTYFEKIEVDFASFQVE